MGTRQPTPLQSQALASCGASPAATARSGEDVTSNLRTIKSIPLTVSHAQLKKAGLTAPFEVRGEVLMPTRSFQAMNEQREEQGLAPFANPRNAAAGAVRVLEPNVTAARRLDFYSYFLLQEGRPRAHRSGRRWRRWPPRASRSIPTARRAQSIEEMWQFIVETEAARDQLPYEIDGVVVKVN